MGKSNQEANKGIISTLIKLISLDRDRSLTQEDSNSSSLLNKINSNKANSNNVTSSSNSKTTTSSNNSSVQLNVFSSSKLMLSYKKQFGFRDASRTPPLVVRRVDWSYV